jgi:hypothetical protein
MTRGLLITRPNAAPLLAHRCRPLPGIGSRQIGHRDVCPGCGRIRYVGRRPVDSRHRLVWCELPPGYWHTHSAHADPPPAPPPAEPAAVPGTPPRASWWRGLARAVAQLGEAP